MRRCLPWLLFLVALVSRLATAGLESLWYDESFTAWLAVLPLDRAMLATAGDVHPPLWYLIEWLTVRALGNSEWALRFPAGVFSALAVVESYYLVKHLASERAGLIAAGLLAILPGPLY